MTPFPQLLQSLVAHTHGEKNACSDSFFFCITFVFLLPEVMLQVTATNPSVKVIALRTGYPTRFVLCDRRTGVGIEKLFHAYDNKKCDKLSI